MRLRKPELETPNSTIEFNSKTQWKTYQVELVTPLLGGGVTAGEPDEDMPVRASAIRGQLRYWWRFLNQDKDHPDTIELFNQEREIWGGMSVEDEDFSSKVKLKIKRISHLDSPYDYNEQAGYALFPARQTQEEPVKKLIPKGLKFDLLISCPNDTYFTENIEEPLRWWTTFGGLGARTRRGVGSIYINQLKPISPEEARQKNCQLEILRGHEHTYDNAVDAWIAAIEVLQKFRQGENIARNPGTGKKLGRSYWPEPDSIRKAIELSDRSKRFTRHTPVHEALISFPRAAFGLPIITKFTGSNEPNQTELAPTDAERLASPLILTAYPIGNEKYAPASLLMPTQHIDDIELTLKYTSGSGNAIDTFSKNQWWDSSKKDKVTPIKKNGGSDALTAFMNFFKNGGKQS